MKYKIGMAFLSVLFKLNKLVSTLAVNVMCWMSRKDAPLNNKDNV